MLLVVLIDKPERVNRACRLDVDVLELGGVAVVLGGQVSKEAAVVGACSLLADTAALLTGEETGTEVGKEESSELAGGHRAGLYSVLGRLGEVLRLLVSCAMGASFQGIGRSHQHQWNGARASAEDGSHPTPLVREKYNSIIHKGVLY